VHQQDRGSVGGALVDEGDPQRAPLVIVYVVVTGHVGKVGHDGESVVGGAGNVHEVGLLSRGTI
jgi:hypothetical protein